MPVEWPFCPADGTALEMVVDQGPEREKWMECPECGWRTNEAARREKEYMMERGGIFSTAVGIARLRLQSGDPQGAADALDDACDELHVLHFDACVADGHSLEAVERFIGERDRKATRSWRG